MENQSANHSEVLNFNTLINYMPQGIISSQIIRKPSGNITLFSFDAGQGLSEHSAPFDALVQILDGEAIIRIGKNDHRLVSGEAIIMPANIPHAVQSITRFRMLLTMIKD